MNDLRLRSTTALGSVVLTLGSLGIVLGTLGFVAFLLMASSTLRDANAISNSIISLISKVGMFATGVALLRRWENAGRIAAWALVISTVSALHDLATFQVIQAGVRTSKPPWALIGAVAAYVVAASLYLFILFYLRRSAVKREFSHEAP